MEKIEEWFKLFNQKMDKMGNDVLALRGELSDIREFIEQHQTDIRICKLAIERVDEKVETIKKEPH